MAVIGNKRASVKQLTQKEARRDWLGKDARPVLVVVSHLSLSLFSRRRWGGGCVRVQRSAGKGKKDRGIWVPIYGGAGSRGRRVCATAKRIDREENEPRTKYELREWVVIGGSVDCGVSEYTLCVPLHSQADKGRTRMRLVI